MDRKFQSPRRYLLAFLIGTGIFVLGFLIVNWLSLLEYKRISQLQEEISYEIFEDKISYSLFGKDICSDSSYKKISEDLAFQGRIIDDLERKFGKSDDRVLQRKKFYSLILLEHFEFVNIRNEECNGKVNTILFFYSNSLDNIGRSEEVGRILGSVYERNDNVVIYSFDVDLESDLIEELKKRYFVEEPLEILINENIKINNLKNIGEIERHLN